MTVIRPVKIGVEAVFNPVVSGLFPAGRAEAGFTGMGSFDAFVTFGAYKYVIAQKVRTAHKQLENIYNKTESD